MNVLTLLFEFGLPIENTRLFICYDLVSLAYLIDLDVDIAFRKDIGGIRYYYSCLLRTGNESLVSAYLAHSADICSSLLHAAVISYSGSYPDCLLFFITSLLERGIDVNSVADGFTVLQRFCFQKDYPTIVPLLIRFGAKLHLRRSNDGRMVFHNCFLDRNMHYSVSAVMAEKLVAAGVTVDDNEFGGSAMNCSFILK